MKLLHLADLHLGRLFHERSLIEDQQFVLDQVLEILTQDDYKALILAGDIYDRSIPSAEAVNLFSSFLSNLHSRLPQLAICIIAGNHDSPDRLAFGRELFQSMNIHIVTDPNQSFEPVILTDGNESCAVFLLPFLYPGSLYLTEEPQQSDEVQSNRGNSVESMAEPRGLRTQQELITEASRRLEVRRQALAAEGIQHSVLVAHLFTQGGLETESERIFLGTAEQVDVRLFSGFSYVALGHLHRPQQVAPNAWYAGSPLAYSFGEADQEKRCLAVELQNRPGTPGLPSVQPISLKPLHPVRRLLGPFAMFMGAAAASINATAMTAGAAAVAGNESVGPAEPGSAAADEAVLGSAVATSAGAPSTAEDLKAAYLEIELTDEHLVEQAQRLLEQRYPLVLSVKQNRAFQALLQAQAANQRALPDGANGSQGRRRNTLDDFTAFEESLYGTVDQGKLELFTTLLEQIHHETP
jgi:exonuclease SbcD